MASMRPLRGSCHCGRYRYIVERPLDTTESVPVLIDANRLHETSVASPLPAFLRVPLSWYHSSTHALFPDESRTAISRFYSPADSSCRRNFCGFCGTPLSFWSEEPHSEAEYIQVSLGSLLREDLHDLEELGYVLGSEDETERPAHVVEPGSELTASSANSGSSHGTKGEPPNTRAVGSKVGTSEARNRSTNTVDMSKKDSFSKSQPLLHQRVSTQLPWFEGFFDDFMAKGRLHRHHGTHTSKDGSTHVEWEVVEWTGDADEQDNTKEEEEGQEGGAMKAVGTASQGKRKLGVLELGEEL
ncbi:hypothetical protein BROUX41_001944 [Berkeleyomyces rouxiae]